MPLLGVEVRNVTRCYLTPCRNRLCYKAVLLTDAVSRWQQKEKPAFEGVLTQNAQMPQMSPDREGGWGRSPAKNIRKGGFVGLAPKCRLSIQEKRSICNTAPHSLEFFLIKQWKRPEVSNVLAFQTFVPLSGVQRAFSRPFFRLGLKVNYDLGVPSAPWHLRLSHC